MSSEKREENQELIEYVAMCLKGDGLLPKDTRSRQEKKEDPERYSSEQMMCAIRWLDKNLPGWSVTPTPKPKNITWMESDEED